MCAVGVIEGPQGVTDPWSEIDWNKVRCLVSRLQARIVKAVRAGKWHRVRCLQRLLANSRTVDRRVPHGALSVLGAVKVA